MRQSDSRTFWTSSRVQDGGASGFPFIILTGEPLASVWEAQEASMVGDTRMKI